MLKIISKSHVKHGLQNRTTVMLVLNLNFFNLLLSQFLLVLYSCSLTIIIIFSKFKILKRKKLYLQKQKCSSNCSGSTCMSMYITLFYFCFCKEINDLLIIWNLGLLYFLIFLYHYFFLKFLPYLCGLKLTYEFSFLWLQYYSDFLWLQYYSRTQTMQFG